MKLNKYILSVAMAGTMLGMASCDDILDKGNDYVIYSDGYELTTPADTVTSVIGILNKLQAIGVRTNLLGEVRADLVVVNESGETALKDLADFNADVFGEDDANKYNVPRDYYAVINNCNFFLAHADSLAHNNSGKYYFKNEIAQVHSIRAWVYLQAVLAYGRVPLVTEPVTTKLQSEAQYPMVDLAGVCDYFINDLKDYSTLTVEYPDYGSIGGDIDPRMCFFPSMIVMGDLYLYKAAATHDKEAAKKAAQNYYNFIIWDRSGKTNLYTTNQSVSWDANSLYTDRYTYPQGSLSYSYSGTWGRNNSSITAIAMDSAAADGYYNELRNLYNTTLHTDLKEASISPSDYLQQLSESQRYFGWDTQKSIVEVTTDKLNDQAIENHYVGDLRFSENVSKSKLKYNSKEVDFQYCYKHSNQHIGIYRASQVYLRMAEALNYAGYPRFAKQILTMGLSNNVIQFDVMPYYESTEDSTFLAGFAFNNNNFIPYVESYTGKLNKHGILTGYAPVYRSETYNLNMLGIHGRGSGLPFLNPDYCNLELTAADSASYPAALEQSIGIMPSRQAENYVWPELPAKPKEVKEPSTWAKYGNYTCTAEEYEALNAEEPWYKGLNASRKKTAYTNYTKLDKENLDSVGRYNVYVTVTLPAYNADVEAYHAAYDKVNEAFVNDSIEYQNRVAEFKEAYLTWHKNVYGSTELRERESAIVDQYILDEQALELVYEGNRFYDLMRRALWYNDNSKLAAPIGKRNPALGSKLMDRTKWYLKWKNQIGY